MTDPKGIASLVNKRITATPPKGEGGDAEGEVLGPAEDDDTGMGAASEEVMGAFKAGDSVAFQEALTSMIEMVMARKGD